jgi:hypothetical protein
VAEKIRTTKEENDTIQSLTIENGIDVEYLLNAPFKDKYINFGFRQELILLEI